MSCWLMLKLNLPFESCTPAPLFPYKCNTKFVPKHFKIFFSFPSLKWSVWLWNGEDEIKLAITVPLRVCNSIAMLLCWLCGLPAEGSDCSLSSARLDRSHCWQQLHKRAPSISLSGDGGRGKANDREMSPCWGDERGRSTAKCMCVPESKSIYLF